MCLVFELYFAKLYYVSIASKFIFAITFSFKDFNSSTLLSSDLAMYVRRAFRSWSHASLLKVVSASFPSLVTTDYGHLVLPSIDRILLS